MTDEIFDYFGGNSPRKIEPIEQDDFFDDLMPKTEEEPEKVDAEHVESVVESSQEKSIDDEPVEIVEAVKTDEEEKPAKRSHWDILASTLGLAPKKSKKPEKNKKSAAKAVPQADEPVVEEPVKPAVSSISSDSETDSSVDSIFDLESDSEEEPATEVLSEMFVARESEEFESPVEAIEQTDTLEDDDPFAAFHRPTEAQAEISNDTDDVEEDVENESSHLVVSDDFVEFEVKEFGRGNSERDGRRRPRKRKEDQEPKPRRSRSRRDADEEVENETSRRSSRSKRGRERGDEVEEREISPRSRKKSRKDREDADRERDSESGRKKPKVPTWEDAICGVIDKNIKRHKTNSGRGRKRR